MANVLIVRTVTENVGYAVDAPRDVEQNDVTGEEIENEGEVRVFVPEVNWHAYGNNHCSQNVKRLVIPLKRKKVTEDSAVGSFHTFFET